MNLNQVECSEVSHAIYHRNKATWVLIAESNLLTKHDKGPPNMVDRRPCHPCQTRRESDRRGASNKGEARVLRVENQDHFRRAYLRDHPVPHVAALLPRGPRWDAFDAREKRSEAVAWARAPRDGRSLAPIRSPEIDPDKTKDTAPAQTVLGIVTNLSFVSSAEPRVAL